MATPAAMVSRALLNWAWGILYQTELSSADAVVLVRLYALAPRLRWA